MAGLLPGGERIGLLNICLLGSAGFAIMSLATPWQQLPAPRRIALRLIMLLLLVLPLAFLLETLLGVSFGIDLPAPGVLPSAMNPHPGRTSPNAAVALLLLDLALFCLIPPRSRLRAGAAFAATLALGAIGAAALFGHALGLQDLYRLAGFNRLLPLTAALLCLCAAGLWPLLEAAPDKAGAAAGDPERRINRRSAALFATIAVIGGVAGFAVMRSSFEEATARNLLLTARTTATLVAAEIESRLWYPKVIVARSSVRAAMAKLNADGGSGADGASKAAGVEALARLAERFFNDQVTGAQFLDPQGKLLFSYGTLSIGRAIVRHPLRDAGGGATLFWADGYVLETRNDIVEDGRLSGVLVIETRLPRIHELLADVQESAPTTDTLLCSVGATTQQLACGPSRFHRDGVNQPAGADRATVGAALALALDGASGTAYVTDGWSTDGARLIAAYTPVKNFGLALGVDSHVESLYAPLRERVLQLLLALAVLVAAGTLILRSQVRPLVAALGREQRRTARILENSIDAFVALDADGRVTDWNSQAARLFGWPAAEALGRPLAQLILAPAGREPYAAAMADAVRDACRGADGAARGAVLGTVHGAIHGAARQRVELQARHRDGAALPVEMSLTVELSADGYLAHAFIQDISARKAAREALHQSEQRLRLIANNLPALVSYIDRDFRYRFTNVQYQRWFSLPAEALAGKTVAEVFGADIFANVRARIQAALDGEDVAFALDSDIEGAPAKMLVHYIPDRDQHGAVIGVFGMVLDQSAQYLAQARLEASERQLRAVTDNLPIMISYVDTEEKLRFVNGTFREWVGIDDAVGRPLAQVIGAERYAQRRLQLQRALAGERQEFDVESRTLDGRRHLHTVYIPDLREDGATRGVFTVSMDVTRLKLIEEELRTLSTMDTLTGLPNRRQLGDRLALALARHQREQTPLALMFLDIDKFKDINDSHGHGAGDRVLQTFAARLTAATRDSDTVARLAGDEFIIVIEGLGSALDAAQVAEKILAAVRQPFVLDDLELEVRTSIGIAVSLGGAAAGNVRGAAAPVAVGRDELMEAADRALYRAKQAGRDGYQLEVIEARR